MLTHHLNEESKLSEIFISYRRADSRHAAGRIFDRLKTHFGEHKVFMDVTDIPIGIDFRQYIKQHLENCQLMLTIIGDNWLVDENGPSPNCRIEVATALAREDIPVVPILVGDAPIPGEDQLPEDIKALSYRNGIVLNADRDFDARMDSLIKDIERETGLRQHDPETESHAPETDPVNPPAPPTPKSSVKPYLLGAVGAIALLVILFSFIPTEDELNSSSEAATGDLSNETAAAVPVNSNPGDESTPNDCDRVKTYYKAETLREYDAAWEDVVANGCVGKAYTVDLPASETAPEGASFSFLLKGFIEHPEWGRCRQYGDPYEPGHTVHIACQLASGRWEGFHYCPCDEGETQAERQENYDSCVMNGSANT